MGKYGRKTPFALKGSKVHLADLAKSLVMDNGEAPVAV